MFFTCTKFVFTGDDEPTAYLGIAGGYAVGGTATEPQINISGIYRGKTFDAKNTAALLSAYLKDLEKDPEEPSVE